MGNTLAVAHNLLAISGNRMLGINTSKQKKNIERLSSGYRINRAGDDAAGLAISEKMRGQIRGLGKASSNAQDAISLIQTAEGGLNETHGILQRMRELAVQAANDTNTQDDRSQIQNEIDQLTQEVDRIANTTEFNTKKLLNGDYTGATTAVPGTGSVEGNFANSLVNVSCSFSDFGGASQVQVLRFEYEDPERLQSSLPNAQYGLNMHGAVGVVANDGSFIEISNLYNKDLTVSTYTLRIDIDHPELIQLGDSITITLGKGIKAEPAKDGKESLRFQVGANAGQEITLGINAMTSKALGIVYLDNDIADFGEPRSVRQRRTASLDIEAYDKAIKRVSNERAKLGAVQNRLEHTITNLDSAAENTQSAESGIRDTDMASEMVEFSKSNILAQAGQSMLAQANQSTQGVLSLLG